MYFATGNGSYFSTSRRRFKMLPNIALQPTALTADAVKVPSAASGRSGGN